MTLVIAAEAELELRLFSGSPRSRCFDVDPVWACSPHCEK